MIRWTWTSTVSGRRLNTHQNVVRTEVVTVDRIGRKIQLQDVESGQDGEERVIAVRQDEDNPAEGHMLLGVLSTSEG